jgi:hypothetical protein
MNLTRLSLNPARIIVLTTENSAAFLPHLLSGISLKTSPSEVHPASCLFPFPGWYRMQVRVCWFSLCCALMIICFAAITV